VSSRAGERLRRILDAVPFLLAHPGARVDEVCARLATNEAELVADLELLWLCGLPPYGPGDLFDVVIEDDRIWLSGAESLARPFGLDRPMAAKMLLGAKMLSEVPGRHASGDLASGAAKLAAVVGEHPVDVAAAEPAVADVAALLQEALAAHRVVRLTYWSFGRDTEDVRDVEPLRLTRRDGQWYLSAWCRSAEGLRSFRLDRVRSADLLDETFERDVDPGELGYRPRPSDVRVTLDLAPGASWVAERYPTEAREPLEGGGERITMAAPSGAFFERLLVRLGPDARVVDPPWMEDARRDRARKVRALYT